MFFRTSALTDSERYCKRYPNLKDDLKAKDNVLFYSNSIPCRPNREKIDQVLKWFGDYDRLEYNHSYIQWLFPIREQGLNPDSQPLQLHEIEVLESDPKFKQRFLKAYEMMIDFYGFKIKDPSTGELERSENFRDRFAHLNSSFHNFLRITRILKCLGEFGFIKYKISFILILLKEIFQTRKLYQLESSCRRFWVTIIRNDKNRKHAEDLLELYDKLNKIKRRGNQKEKREEILETGEKVISEVKSSEYQEVKKNIKEIIKILMEWNEKEEEEEQKQKQQKEQEENSKEMSSKKQIED